MSTGVAWLDYDQDGLMDLFFVQSATTDIYKPAHPLRCALYHNNGDGTFTTNEHHDGDQILSELKVALHESIERLRIRVAGALSGRRDFQDRRKAS